MEQLVNVGLVVTKLVLYQSTVDNSTVTTSLVNLGLQLHLKWRCQLLVVSVWIQSPLKREEKGSRGGLHWKSGFQSPSREVYHARSVA